LHKMHFRKLKLLIFIIMLAAVMTSCENEVGDVGSLNEDKENLVEVREVSISDKRAEIVIPSSHIKVDQVGYLTLSTKIAMVTNALNVTKFDLIDLNKGEVVLSGELTEAREDAASGDMVQQADFSSRMISGTYVISIPGVGTSHPFLIGEDVYDSVMIDAVRTFTLQRSFTKMDDLITGYRFAAGHPQDANAVVSFSDGISQEGEVLDVSGGWYDAGDYGKYVPPGAASAAFLLMAYEFNPEQLKTGQLAFPSGLSEQEQALGLPDLLSEVKVELDWLLKMQREDGMVYHKVSGLSWPGMDVSPASDTQERYIFGKSTYGTAIFAGTLAMAARIYAPFDQDYADKLLMQAKIAFEYLDQHPDFEYFHEERQDSGSGAYRKSTDKEDRFWAAAELLRTTDDLRYDRYVQEKFSDLFTQAPGIIGFEHPLLFGQWAYYNSAGGSAENKAKLKNAIVAQADRMVQEIQADGYLNSLSINEYVWGSNRIVSSKGVHLIIANELSNKEEYLDAAMEQIHYILGRNAVGTSYVTGVGTVYSSHPHHRIVNSTMVLIPGLLVGGPNRQGGDPTIDKIKMELTPAKSYMDDLSSYSTNEYALDYNAPLCFVLAYFAKE